LLGAFIASKWFSKLYGSAQDSLKSEIGDIYGPPRIARMS